MLDVHRVVGDGRYNLLSVSQHVYGRGAGAIQTGGARAPPFLEVGGGQNGHRWGTEPGHFFTGHGRIKTIVLVPCAIFLPQRNLPTTEQGRLNHLLILHCHRDRLDQLDLKSVAQEFISANEKNQNVLVISNSSAGLLT